MVSMIDPNRDVVVERKKKVEGGTGSQPRPPQ
jgi:hypothetical protein